MLDGKTILITGGTGSFGRNFVKHILANYNPKKVIVFSRDELKQSQMRHKLSDARVRYFIGDIRDLSRLQRAFHGVDVIIHAAALKQIDALEYNPFEAINTNILGTKNVIEAAIDQRVKKVVFVSTDKAAQPVNLYGATKLCAEKLIIDANTYSPTTTHFSCVRYGNVLGSRGSIVEVLLRGKKDGTVQSIKITDERMTRFWITLDQAFALVMFALEHMAGGEIFVPRIPSMKIVDLFDAIVPELKREIMGIRPGEKLHEVLLTSDEARHAYGLEEYFVILPESREIFDIEERFKKFIGQGQALPNDFSFASDKNEEWITKESLKTIIDSLDI
ncbi:MAG: UDP-N-acetylglucosamine 4,6-dehydratase (inverting) [Candidatus Buchananbacteria bacterium CG10_big_fil_rev_8_21_14_0_10_42_9]|uniref:UDP-N-acetylglucosamine 4,6-dehydratase (Inverting) n=1 Tax=Candidatus Buchananbacteria bacterium CG10_big_fil_rev_8_21_14_0_10_42_9 TaxID=1974526 RepID=A0A2H0W1T8_9BACT|nr:MAG: UDP-N-acetylglucosamine 4,6-dehydratase (inverting) [Candidatus Buchananbacteria bacterium CG10_big_fil_rev_8_21_14_0_10_42_9]